LVLRGIGGWTIAEAKRRMTYDEFVTWRAFINKHGLPALGSEATERAFAVLTWRLDRANGGKTEISDWLPRPRTAEDTQTLKMARMLGIKV
jgi:hypothetical protein